jgi:hypothetical protein
MIENMTKFKQQCKEYEEFIENIKEITKDYCVFHKKNNPLESWYFGDADGIEIDADEDGFNIYWQEEVGSCGDYCNETRNLYIPLDFYDNIDEYTMKKNKALKEIKILDNKKRENSSKLSYIQSQIWNIDKDERLAKDNAKKYDYDIPTNSFKKKREELDKEKIKYETIIKEIDKSIQFWKKDL